MKKTLIIIASLALGAAASQAAVLCTTTFNRTGTSLDSVTVSTVSDAGLSTSSSIASQDFSKSSTGNDLLASGSIPDDFPRAVEQNVRLPIFSMEAAKALSAEAVRQGKQVPFHFALDTGMSRIGFQVNEESADICKAICDLPGIYPEGLFSHFATP